MICSAFSLGFGRQLFFGLLTVLTLSAGEITPALKSTEIIIVGTVHKETKAFASKDLLAILKAVHPEVILCERDSSFFTRDFKFNHLFGGLEETAICEYLKTEQALLRPYDIEGRNQFYRDHDTFNLEEAFSKELQTLARSGKLDPVVKETLKIVYASFQKRDAFGLADPRHINSFDCDSVLAEKWFAMDQGYTEIIKRTPELKRYDGFHHVNRAFELERNNTMVRNIVNHAEAFQGKRIVVICGFEHRHFLRIHLSFIENPSFRLNEYWDYEDKSIPGK